MLFISKTSWPEFNLIVSYHPVQSERRLRWLSGLGACALLAGSDGFRYFSLLRQCTSKIMLIRTCVQGLFPAGARRDGSGELRLQE